MPQRDAARGAAKPHEILAPALHSAARQRKLQKASAKKTVSAVRLNREQHLRSSAAPGRLQAPPCLLTCRFSPPPLCQRSHLSKSTRRSLPPGNATTPTELSTAARQAKQKRNAPSQNTSLPSLHDLKLPLLQSGQHSKQPCY